MEVPDLMAKFDGFFPTGPSPLSDEGIDAAIMLTPGAITSGCFKKDWMTEVTCTHLFMPSESSIRRIPNLKNGFSESSRAPG